MGGKALQGYFYAIEVTGLLDMRDVQGPFLTEREAKCAAKEISKKSRGDADPLFIGSWYTIHPGDGYAEGPFLYQRHAEQERKRNVREQPGIYKDDLGFTAQVRTRLRRAAVVCKNGETPQEKVVREEKFNREWDNAIEQSNRYLANRGIYMSYG